jgi:hypothetical protein
MPPLFRSIQADLSRRIPRSGGVIIGPGPQMIKRSPTPALTPLRLVAIGLGLILIAGAAFLLLRPSAETAPTEQSVEPLTLESIPRVNLPDARLAYESGSAVFVDVRDESSFESAHIPGALSIPLNALPDREDELDPNTWIITYCT